MDASTALTLLVLGLGTGAAYALFALGYSLVYGVLGMMNLAHGDILMIATFVCLGVWEATGSALLAVGAGLAVGALTGALTDQVAYRPLRYTGDAVAPLVAALGAALVLRNVAASTFGTERSFPDLVTATALHVAGARLPVAALVAVGGSVAATVAVRRFLERTRAGGAVLAVAQDVTAARLVGIPVWLAALGVYALAGAVAAVGGILYASTFSALKLSLGWTATVVAFTAAVLGGTGGLLGAVLGGLALGVAESFAAYNLPPGYREALAFFALVIVLVARPRPRLGPVARPSRPVALPPGAP